MALGAATRVANIIARGLDRSLNAFNLTESNLLIAFDARTGRERWRFSFSPTYVGHDGSYNGPMSTPLIDGNLTIALGPRGRLFALDNLEGELVWSTDLTEDHGAKEPLYGFATSPMLYDGQVIVEIGAESGAIAAFHPETGERRWALGTDGVNAQTPIPMNVNGRRQLLAAGDTSLMGIDAASGRLLWQYEHGGKQLIGAGSLVPVAAGPDRLFLNYKDDSSTLVELMVGAGAPTGTELWEERTIRNTYAVAVFHEGYLYGFSSRFLTCIDASTGKAVWKSRPPGDGFLILVDGHLVILTKDGSVHVAKATPEGYQETAGQQLFEDLAWTPPSFADGSLFVRSLGEIARVEIRSASEATEEATAEAAETDVVEGDFARFLAEVREAEDKSAVVDRFLASQSSFPIIENERLVHFLYRGEADDMAIAGDMIGARQEAPMTRVEGTDLFYYSTEILPEARVSYLFVKDYQDQLTDPLNPVTSQWAILGKDMRVVFVGGEPMDISTLAMPRWQTPAHLTTPAASARRGRLERHELESASMGRSHSFEVYLPTGYDEKEDRYPVIYVHGGALAVRLGQLPATLDNLIGNRLEPVIAVFIHIGAGHIFMTRDRYGEMWAKELVPFIDRTYRTKASAEARANVGAGIFAHEAAHCAFRYPGLSSRLAIQSLLMVDYGRERLEPLIRTGEEHPLHVHVEWGTYDLRNPQEAWDLRDLTRSFADYLRERGYDVETYEAPEGTGWPAWKNRSHAVLESLFPRVEAGGSR